MYSESFHDRQHPPAPFCHIICTLSFIVFLSGGRGVIESFTTAPYAPFNLLNLTYSIIRDYYCYAPWLLVKLSLTVIKDVCVSGPPIHHTSSPLIGPFVFFFFFSLSGCGRPCVGPSIVCLVLPFSSNAMILISRNAACHVLPLCPLFLP